MSEQHPSLPDFRIFTFGGFSVERLVREPSPLLHEPRYESVPKEAWKRRQAARALLKVLICRHGRRVSREEVLDLLWSETDAVGASGSLTTASSIVRTIFSPDGEESLLKTTRVGQVPMLTLADQQRIWVDADAFEVLLDDAAQVQRHGQDPLPLLEQAQQLVKGTFLEEDIYCDWTQARRQTLAAARCRLFYRLADLYEQRNMAEKAEEILQTFHAEDPTNEDVLCRLMVLLAQRGRRQEALHSYQRTVQVLHEELNTPPSANTRTLAEQIRREPITFDTKYPLSKASSLPHPSLLSFSQERAWIIDSLSEASDAPSEQQMSNWLTHGAGHLGWLFDEGWSFEAIVDALRIVLPVMKAMPMSTRHAFLRADMSSMLHGISLRDGKRDSGKEAVPLHLALSESIAAMWKRFLSTENAHVLAIGQAQLSLVQLSHTLLYPPTRSFLYTGTYGLIGIALHCQERDEEALHAHHSGYIAALATGDPWYVAQSLICQADCHHALGQYDSAIQRITEALSILRDPTNEAQICAKAHLLASWADNAMMLGDYKTTQEKFDAARAYLDHITPNEEFDRASWLLLMGKYALITKKYATAMRFFEEALAELPEEWILRRAMTALGLTKAYAQMKERNKSLEVAGYLVPMMKTINARMINRWFAEYIQQDLLDIFPTDVQVHAFVADIYQQLPQLTSIHG